MFNTICDLVPRDDDLPERAWKIDVLRRVLDGSIYDVLPFEFHQERSESGEYIPIRQRRPSVRYALARVVVEDSVSLLFSDGHFPGIESPDGEVRKALNAIVADAQLNAVMTEAGLRGSVGSVALVMRVLMQRVFVEVMDTEYLAPIWDPNAPDTLLHVTERMKAGGAELASQGYDIDDISASYWFARRWDANEETWFVPVKVGMPERWDRDDQRSVVHRLGLVPVVWIRNLPGTKGADGTCTFRAAVETGIEIDYQLSQAGRGLKYSSDPTLLIKEPAGLEGTIVRGAANALVVSDKGDAKLLEIGGTASQAVIDYVKILRELALESIHGNRADASRLTAPASGRAIELMNQGLLWLADNLRVSYGGGLLSLARMILRASDRYPLRVAGHMLPKLDAEVTLWLDWPEWYPMDSLDRQRKAQTLTSLVAAKQISRATAMGVLGADYGIVDTTAERARIKAEEDG